MTNETTKKDEEATKQDKLAEETKEKAAEANKEAAAEHEKQAEKK